MVLEHFTDSLGKILFQANMEQREIQMKKKNGIFNFFCFNVISYLNIILFLIR